MMWPKTALNRWLILIRMSSPLLFHSQLTKCVCVGGGPPMVEYFEGETVWKMCNYYQQHLKKTHTRNNKQVFVLRIPCSKRRVLISVQMQRCNIKKLSSVRTSHNMMFWHIIHVVGGKGKKRCVWRVNKGNSPESKCELRAKPGLKYDADMIRSARAAGILSIPKMLLGFALKQMCPR